MEHPDKNPAKNFMDDATTKSRAVSFVRVPVLFRVSAVRFITFCAPRSPACLAPPFARSTPTTVVPLCCAALAGSRVITHLKETIKQNTVCSTAL
jgi:hypothetical protein